MNQSICGQHQACDDINGQIVVVLERGGDRKFKLIYEHCDETTLTIRGFINDWSKTKN